MIPVNVPADNALGRVEFPPTLNRLNSVLRKLSNLLIGWGVGGEAIQKERDIRHPHLASRHSILHNEAAYAAWFGISLCLESAERARSGDLSTNRNVKS